MGGKSTLRTRQKALDRVFGQWVRLRAANGSGMAQCVSCGISARVDVMNAGHFWKRQHQATRYDPHNVHVQCVRCNNFRGGAEAEHAAYILKTYGLDEFERLEARHRGVKKWTPSEVENMILYYKSKLKELDNGV